MEEKTKIIKIQAGMSDPKGKLIPRGVQERLTVDIVDNIAVYYFKDSRVTRNFAMIEIEGNKAKGLPPTTSFNSRQGKAIRLFIGKNKEEIRDNILKELKLLNANGVKVRNG